MIRVFIVAAMVFIADQLSKWWVLERLFAHKLTNADGMGFKAWIGASSLPTLPPVQIELWPFFNLSMAWNKGISFSMLYSESAQMPLILSGFAIGVACAFLVWAYKNHHRGERLGIALIVGGALANAYDRIRFGAVADFLDVFYKDWHYPAFNLADSAITIGVGVILLYGFVLNRKG